MSHLPFLRHSPLDASRGYQFRGPRGTVSGSLDMIGEDIRAGLMEDGMARLMNDNSGGNVHQNVDAKHLSIDTSGHLNHANYFAIVKWEPAAPTWL